MGITLRDLVSDAQLEALYRPTAHAWGLPGSAYTDDRFWQLERRHLFATTWLGCAFVSDLAEPATVFPVSICGWEIIITRDRGGSLHAFHNVCRHRAMRVVAAPCEGVDSLSCPWHGWTYDLQGRLIATPGIGGARVDTAEGIDKCELGLKPIRCETWAGFVFINLDGKAPPLADYLQTLRSRLAGYDLELLRTDGHTRASEFKGNWKLVMEGGVENYHMPWVHPGAGGHSGLTREDYDETGSYVGIATRWPQFEAGDGEQSLPRFPHLNGPLPDDGFGWEDLYFFVLPGTIVEVTDSYVVAVLISPLSTDRTLMRRIMYFVGDTPMTAEFAETRVAMMDFWHEIGEQDCTIVERLQHQQQQRTDAGVETRFSPHWESAVHRFQQLVVERLQRD